MEFLVTPDEARRTAEAVVAYLEAENFKVRTEVEVDPTLHFRPTVTAKKTNLTLLVEAQFAPSYTPSLKDLVHWLTMQRVNCEVYLAVPAVAELSGRLLTELKRNGVGLFLVEGKEVTKQHDARNPALIVTPDPGLALGPRKQVVGAAVRKFNDGERKNGLQDMCEIVETETDKLLKRLASKNWITKTADDLDKMDWSTQIDVAAADNVYVGNRKAIVDSNLKTDLHSFRSARNLIDHKVTTPAAERRRQAQFAERMHMGPRLVAELLSVKKQIT